MLCRCRSVHRYPRDKVSRRRRLMTFQAHYTFIYNGLGLYDLYESVRFFIFIFFFFGRVILQI